MSATRIIYLSYKAVYIELLFLITQRVGTVKIYITKPWVYIESESLPDSGGGGSLIFHLIISGISSGEGG